MLDRLSRDLSQLERMLRRTIGEANQQIVDWRVDHHRLWEHQLREPPIVMRSRGASGFYG
jgi:hypothetical protein